jgi:putative alpha-1,2-mannosidase
MSIVGDGAAAATTVAAQVDAGTGLDGAGNPFGQTSCSPSIHDVDSSSSDES